MQKLQSIFKINVTDFLHIKKLIDAILYWGRVSILLLWLNILLLSANPLNLSVNIF